jgi:hypothetical protein
LGRLTEDSSVDDVSVGQSDFDGVFFVGDVGDPDRQLFVGEQDVSVGVKDSLKWNWPD